MSQLNILPVSDMVAATRNETLLKYEDYIPADDPSDRTYLRAFEREFRAKLDSIVSASASNVVLRDDAMDEVKSTPDGHSAWLMTAEAQRCFPCVFIRESEIRGMTPDERHRYLVERKYSGQDARPDKWNKYSKGKTKR